MEQYLDLGREILQTQKKDSARDGMPTTLSKFGHQMRFDLREGFPIVTTKEINFKNIVVELLWFLKGDTNIKYLVDNGCNIWNEDAYNYYVKLCKRSEEPNGLFIEDIAQNKLRMQTFEEFVEGVKEGWFATDMKYRWGDCGKQYGWLWRKWKGEHIFGDGEGEFEGQGNRYVSGQKEVDQIKTLIRGLKENPNSRRHILSAWNPLTLDEMALPACHSLVQFNCEPIPWETKLDLAKRNPKVEMESLHITEAAAGNREFGVVPQYYLDTHLYQRSGDYFLGVPYNISSYALLTSILAEVVNMVPRYFIHSLGDVHIYSNHIEQVKLQTSRKPHKLPRLSINTESWKAVNQECGYWGGITEEFDESVFESIQISDFTLSEYISDSKIKGELSTGMRR